MVLKLNLSNDAARFLKKRDTKQFTQILSAIATLAVDPRPADSILMANSTHYRKDQGEFRIIYHFDDQTLFITVVGLRNDTAAYQEFDRKNK